MNNKVVYFHKRNDTNEVFYVGIGNPKRPSRKNSRSTHWWNIVNKVGYTIEILHEGLTWDEAVQYEVKYIKDFGRKDIGTGTLVNQTDGGEGCINNIVSKETRKKISIGNIGKVWSDERKEKWCGKNNHLWGNTPWNKGLSHSEDVIIKLKDNHKGMSGQKHSMTTKIKMSESNKSRKLTKEDVLWIRENYIIRHKKYGGGGMSKKFNVTPQLIRMIVKRKAWNHV